MFGLVLVNLDNAEAIVEKDEIFKLKGQISIVTEYTRKK